MTRTLAEWDARHRGTADGFTREPASFFSELLPILPAGPALDLACGSGRHTIALGIRGQSVTAVDGSSVALDIVEDQARANGLSFKRKEGSAIAPSAHSRIQLMRADLETAILPADSFTLIVCVNYLQRSLFEAMQTALLPGGMLLFETFTREQLRFDGGPKNPDYMLEQGELRASFPRLRTLFYRELAAGQGIASLLAQKPEKAR